MKNRKTLVLLVGVLIAAFVNFNMVNDPLNSMDLLFDNIESLANDETGKPTCAAGGCYATSCSFSGEIEILGNGAHYSNSVSCEDAWACCFTTAYCFDKSRC